MPLYASVNIARVARNFNSSAAIGRVFFTKHYKNLNFSSQIERGVGVRFSLLSGIKKGPATTTSPDMEKPPTQQERRLVDTVYITKPPSRKRGVIRRGPSGANQDRTSTPPNETKGGT